MIFAMSGPRPHLGLQRILFAVIPLDAPPTNMEDP